MQGVVSFVFQWVTYVCMALEVLSQKILIAFCVRAITELPYALYLPSRISVLSR